MSKNHDLGLDSWIVRTLRVFLLARVPFKAAVMDNAGDLVLNDGGAKRRLLGRKVALLGLVGERPAAGGAETGVIDWKVSVLGVEIRGVCILVDTVLRERRDGLEVETSSSNVARFLLPIESIRLGSTFSESEFSGEAARRFRAGADEGVRANAVS